MLQVLPNAPAQSLLAAARRQLLLLLAVLSGLLVLARPVQAQPTKADSLEQEVRTAHDTVQVKALCKLSFLYLYTKPERSLALARQALAQAQQLNYSKGIAAAYNNLGSYYYNSGNYAEAMRYQQLALALRRARHDEFGVAQSLLNIGNAYYGQGRLPQAVNSYLAALRFSEKLKRDGLSAMLYTNIANVYSDLQNNDAALANMFKAISTRQRIHDVDGLSFTYNNTGVIYRDLKKYDLAQRYFRLAADAATASGNKSTLAYALSNTGDTYVRQGHYAQALPVQQQALVLQQQLGDQAGIAGCLVSLGSTYQATGNLAQAEASFQQARAIGQVLKSNKVLIEAVGGLAAVASARRDYQQALALDRQQSVLKDSLTSENGRKEIAELGTKYETSQKEQRIVLLNQENQLQRAVIARRNYLIGLAIALILGVLAWGGLFYSRYKRKQDARLQHEILVQQDLATTAILEAEENERRRIAGELHDGLGQMFSTVKMNLSSVEQFVDFKDETARQNFTNTLALVDESCREVRSISHQMAPNALLKSGLVSAIRDFIRQVDQRSLKINLHVQGLTERLAPNTEAVLYRVLQEVVNNVIKHAHATCLDIQLVKDEDGLSVMVEDDGVGFDSAQKAQAEGMGLKNIGSRIAFLKGTVDFDSAPGRGTAVSVWVPA